MRRKTVSGIMLALLFIGMLTLAFNIQPAEAEPTTIIVPDDYEKIQWAVGNASYGDTIFVRAGTYYENLTVDTSISLIGEDKYNTIVDGRIDLSASNVNITGFTARLIGVGGSGNTIIDNLASAIGLWYGYDGGGNTVVNNIVLNYMEYTFGINVYVADNNTIINNKVVNFTYGIRLYHSRNNVIKDNEVLDNRHGIILEEGSCYNTIYHNNVKNGYSGVFVRAQYNPSDNNTISGNNMISNYIGIWLSESSNNRFYHNNFIDNTEQVHLYQSFNNLWHDGYPSGGNYWNDYTGVDLDHDGIGDSPLVIDADNQDNYPLMGMFSSFPISYQEEFYAVDVICNSTISGFEFDHENRIIDFDVTGSDGTIGFCRIVIPRALIESPYTILVDGQEIPYTESPISNITHAFLYFTYSHSIHHIKIFTSPPPEPVGGEATLINIPMNKPETPTLLIWLSTIMLSLAVTVVYVKKRKRERQIG